MAEGFEIPAGSVVLETAVDFHEIDRQIDREMPERGQRAGEAAGKGFRRGFDKAVGDDAGKKVEESLKGAEEGAKGVRAEAERLSGQLDETDSSMGAVAETGSGLALIFSGRLVAGMKGLLGWVGRTTSGLLALTSVGLLQTADGLKKMGRELAESESRFRKLGPAIEKTGTALEGVAGILVKVSAAITGAKVAVAGLATGIILLSKRAADDFRSSWNRVLTLIPEGTEGLRKLRHEVSAMAADLGETAETANNTFYQVLSAMPELVEEPARALEVLRVALEVGATEFADAATAAEAITAILNAFQLEAEDARRVADKLFAAQDQGVLTFQDIASEIGKVSDFTNVLGGEFEELLAIVATITPTGQSVSDIFTQLRAVLRSFVDPSDQAAAAAEEMGVDLSAAAIESKGLLGAITDLIKTTEGSPEAISQLIPRAEAQTLLVSLATKLDGLERRYQEIGNTADTTNEKLDQMQDSWQAQQDRARELVNHDLRVLGSAYERMGTKSLQAINDLHKGLQGIVDLSVDLIDTPGKIARAWDDVELSIQNVVRELAGLPPIVPERESFRREIDPRRRRSAAGTFADREFPEDEGGFTEAFDSPDSPAQAVAEGIQEFRAAREVSAALELMRTGDMRQYEAALRAIKLEVNDLVESEAGRLQQFGIMGAELQPLLSLYDQEAEKYRNLKLELTPLQDAYEDFLEAASKLPDVVGPDVEGFREGPGGMLEVDPDQSQKLAQLQRFTEELSESQIEGGEAALLIRERMDELDLTYDELTRSIRMNIRAIGLNALSLATLGFEVEGTEEEASDLQSTLEDIEGMARGLLAVADAAGVLSDDLRQALQGAIDLAGAMQTINAQGLTVGSAAQGVGGVIGIVQGLGQALTAGQAERAAAQQRLVDTTRELRAAFEELVRSADAVRAVFGEVPGGIIGAAQDAFEGFEVPEGSSEEAAREQISAFHERRRAAGLSTEDLLALVQELPGDFPSLTALLGGGGTIDPSTIGAEIEAFMRMLGELDMSRLTEGWDQAISEIENRFQILDIDDPLQKLEAYRDAFLEFADLPEGLQQEIENLNLGTAEGRARLEAIMAQLFEQMRAGELDPGALGKMTAEEFEEALLKIEGLADQVGEGEGASRSFQIFRGVSEVQAHQMLGKLDTGNVILRFIWDELIAIRGGMGFEAPTQGPTLLPPGPTVEPHEGMTNPPEPRAPRAPSDSGTLSLNVDSTVNVEAGVGEDAESIARRVSEHISGSVPRDLLRKLKEEMAEDYLSEQRTLGRVRKV